MLEVAEEDAEPDDAGRIGVGPHAREGRCDGRAPRPDIIQRSARVIHSPPTPPAQPRQPKPDWLKVRAPGSPSYPRLEGPDARAEPPHRLRGSAVPEHRRVLEPRHRDVHDPRRRVHARLLVLRGRRTAGPERGRHRRAGRASPTPSARSISTTSSSPRSIATTSTDGGASIFADTIRETRARLPQCRIEVLIPDFQGNEAALHAVLDARPDVLNHNTETVPRLYRMARSGGRYHADARAARSRAPLRAGHPDQDRRDGRPRRGARRADRDVPAICATSAAAS